MENLTPFDLKEVFVRLQMAGLEAIVVGGQAVNLWAYQYRDRSPALLALQPFASEDLDFYGGKVEALTCRDALQGKVRLNEDFDPSPNAGVVLMQRGERVLRIDFLASVYGLNDSEITGTAITFSGRETLTGIDIKVLNPILCLEGKLKCLRHLPQQGRQDLKHVKIAMLCVKEFLKDLCSESEPRIGLKLVERVLANATREDGLSAWYRHQIHVESAVPLETLAQFTDEKWRSFNDLRVPQVTEQIAAKRQHYERVMAQIAAARARSSQSSKDFDLGD
jgi:hypothetical protein